jgi:LysR family transcriptional regulator, nitrogen assimilation regulatory protein
MNAVTFPVRLDVASLNSEAREKALGVREFRSFLSLASTGNVGRTARDLNVSQPAISLQLRKLEDAFGAQLVRRHGRGVTLTPAGASLRDRLHTVMQLLTSPLDDSLADTPPARLSLAIPGELGLRLASPLATMFRQRWPDLMLDFKEGNGADLEEWVLHRCVDLAILQDPPFLPELDTTPLLTEPLGLVLPVHCPLSESRRPLSMRELMGAPLILPGQSHWIRRRLDHAAQQYGVRLNPVSQVTSLALIKAMVRGGVGHTVLPRAAVQDEVDAGSLTFRPIGQPPLHCTRVLAFHRSASNSLVPDFAELVCDSVTALASRGAWAGAQVVSRIATGTILQRGSGATSPNASQVMEELAIR